MRRIASYLTLILVFCISFAKSEEVNSDLSFKELSKIKAVKKITIKANAAYTLLELFKSLSENQTKVMFVSFNYRLGNSEFGMGELDKALMETIVNKGDSILGAIWSYF